MALEVVKLPSYFMGLRNWIYLSVAVNVEAIIQPPGIFRKNRIQKFRIQKSDMKWLIYEVKPRFL